MAAKPRTDEERRTWLQLSKLKSERDKLEHERHQLRRQLHAAISSGEYWQGPPQQELNERLEAVTRQWNAVINQIREIYDARRPPSALPSSQQSFVLGGRQEIGVIMTRLR